ncbi:SRPBCC family protein [Cohnella caldifontis]|uniref:SRPBCC family protein n=1 Tax=Cohnella caldifontis TaxID=3027471 RepID=UPI0023ED5ED8|nr:SRPBCC family protein [Cohnella sp. YIM B05605]
MSTYAVTVEQLIEASHPKVYQVVTDMEEHRRILPKQFESLEVLKGGKGAGTVFRLKMNVLGNRSTLEMTISEPEPGRVIQEKDAKAGVTTTWLLTPTDGGSRCRIRLTSEFRSKPGIAGWLERFMVPPVIRSIYRQELQQINQYLSSDGAAG